ncbi:hypothetical protein HUE87_11370 [Candidatus Sulfurimonas marisnigri]|uniref:Uncharacterized protein n=1 Tax=Candidatus Sulfurimonas marisnigri TaxID=2740405 RepID=A0A7S7RQA1_9BACT|nr:hypothetical protein [Candidatus Sulfurimonas marisnigri]QOY54461.1 hypothetical protein HUE87_11370 [Candidatus Sulfurimonas marisnigri]
MKKGCEVLKEVGAQKIHEATHISREYVQAILHESFEGMTRVQLFGFISIFEREYSVDLSELKSRAEEYFNIITPQVNEENRTKVFLPSNKKRNLAPIYIGVAIAIFVAFALLNIKSINSKESKNTKVDNSVINSAKSNITLDIKDENSSTIEKVESTKEVTIIDDSKNEAISFKIIPRAKVWLGYIDLSTHKKNQTIFSDEFSLDPSKEWLLAFGHGHINIEINGVVTEYKDPKTVRFLYKDAELKKLNFEEFRSLNRGNIW